MKKIFAILAIGISLVFNAQQHPYYQQAAKYVMNIDVDAANFTYAGNQTITYTNNSPDELKTVYFHLYWNAFKAGSMMDERVASQGAAGDSRLQQGGVSRLASIPKNEEGAQNIKWIKQNGKILKFEIQETIMKVVLAEPLKPNSTTTFTMEWDAVIPKQIRRAGRNNREGIDMTMTQWYPKIAEYDYDGWAAFDYIGREFHAPFADFEVNIKIDPQYIIGAGGMLTNEREVPGYTFTPKTFNTSSKVTWKWKADKILDFAWAADRDYTVEKMSIFDGPEVYFVYQKNEKTKLWEESKPYVKKYFDIMNNTFGKYPYSSYAFIQGGDGGMEYGMCTMILGEAKSLNGLLGLMVHEGAHSWFQQIIATNESKSPWLDEGFTSYAESVVMSQLFPPNPPASNPFVSTLKNYANFAKSGREEPASWLADHHDGGTPYSYASYVKGETYLIQLGYIVGEQTLSQIMKAYFNQWKFKHPTERDFLHIAQKISGMDLQWFHHYWINTTKVIDYRVKDVQFGPKETTVTLENIGSVPMPVDFSVLLKNNQVVNYQIPLNMTREWKKRDIYGNFSTLPYWPWTRKEYTFTVPYKKAEISALGIDFSKRLADVNNEDNFVEVK